MRFAKGLLIVLAVFLLAACASSTPSFPTGEYKDFGGWRNTFHADGKLTLENTLGEVLIDNGSYSVEGDVITFIDNGYVCETLVGVYNWSVDEDGVLQFETIDDECVDRRSAFTQGLKPVR